VDVAVARLAGRQHGMVSVRQLRSLGLSDREIQRRREAGRLHRSFRGVYAVGHVPRTPEASYMAAVLAVRGAVLSHRSAAALYGFWNHDHGAIDVTCIRKGASRPGILRHWTRSLHSAEVTTRHGIPVTTPVRTATDLADVAAPNAYELALRSAERMGLLDRAQVCAIHGRRGAGLVASRAEPERSPLESAFRALLVGARLRPTAP
jgi:predicted transcriptional regulator of viral defense system